MIIKRMPILTILLLSLLLNMSSSNSPALGHSLTHWYLQNLYLLQGAAQATAVVGACAQSARGRHLLGREGTATPTVLKMLET